MSNLPQLDAHAAFVDVGSEQMHVSIAGGPPEVFGTVTWQLDALRDWLLARGVRSVAMGISRCLRWTFFFPDILAGAGHRKEARRICRFHAAQMQTPNFV